VSVIVSDVEKGISRISSSVDDVDEQADRKKIAIRINFLIKKLI
jgi:hypothetical protein